MSWIDRHHGREADLIAWIDGELGQGERAALERHLATCHRCTELRARQQRAQLALARELAGDAADVTIRYSGVRAGAVGAGAGVLAGSLGAVLVAGLVLRRRRRGAPALAHAV